MRRIPKNQHCMIREGMGSMMVWGSYLTTIRNSVTVIAATSHACWPSFLWNFLLGNYTKLLWENDLSLWHRNASHKTTRPGSTFLDQCRFLLKLSSVTLKHTSSLLCSSSSFQSQICTVITCWKVKSKHLIKLKQCWMSTRSLSSVYYIHDIYNSLLYAPDQTLHQPKEKPHIATHGSSMKS